MNDPLGMDSTAEIVTPPDVIELAWKRYDAIARVEDLAWREWNARDKFNKIECDHLLQRAKTAQANTVAARDDKNIMTDKNNDCQCNDHNQHYGTVCSFCEVYNRVMAWYREQK